MSEQLLCTGCNLAKTCRTKCMTGRGNANAPIMVVGEAPGEDEDRQGTPFVGASGRFLRKHLLRGSGVDESDLFITNAVRCHPAGNKKPTISNVRTCRHFLEDEIRSIKPKVILLLGNVALHSLVNIYKAKESDDEKKSSGLSGISQWRGIKLWSREFNCWLVPTYHPAALLRDLVVGITYREDQAIEDFELAGYLAEKPLPTPTYPISYRVGKVEKALEVIQYMRKQPIVAFDIETEDLDTETNLLGVSLANSAERGFYITAVADSHVQKAIAALLTDSNIIKLMHNGAFDQRFLRAKGYPAAINWQDTMIAASLVDENFSKGLKPLAWRYTMFGGYDKELDEYRRVNKLKTYAGIPESVMSKYAAYDACATYQLYNIFRDELEKIKLAGLYTGVLMPVRDVLNDIEVTGFNVDTKRAEYLNTLCDKAVEHFKQQIYELAGEEFNIRSTPQLGNILYNKLKLKPLKSTAGKVKAGTPIKYSCDKASLEYIASQKKGLIAQVLLDMKYIQSQQSKFINLILTNVRSDGRIHTTYNSAGTVTGRLSCSRPGIHNIPRDRLIRSIFIPSPGNVLIEADVKSAELRALGVYSGEKFLLDAFNQGRDLHTDTYNMMFDKPADYKPTDDERFIAKSINFGLVYGRGPGSLGKVLKVSTEEAADLIELYFSRMPGVAEYLTNCVAKAHKQGYVTSLFGRRRRLPLINADDPEVVSHAERQAKNSPIQSAAADYTYIVLKRTAAVMKKHNVKAKIVHTVHDCLIIDSPPEEADFLVDTIKRAYSHPVKEMPIKMEMDVDVVSVWGEHKDSLLEAMLVKAGVIKAAAKPVKGDDDLIFDDDTDEEDIN